MQYDNFIDSVSAFEKLGIESSWQTRDDKELAKARVDCLASILKGIRPFPGQELNINIEWIRQIKKFALQYSVEKVVLFPYPVGYQQLAQFIRVYGGKKDKFWEAIGAGPLISNNVTQEIRTNIDQWINEYGVILYESC